MAEGKGRWVTIKGAKVYIGEDGKPQYAQMKGSGKVEPEYKIGNEKLSKAAIDAKDVDDFIRKNIKELRAAGIDSKKKATDYFKDEKYKATAIYSPEPLKDSIQTIKDGIRPQALSGWFRNADSDYKPEIEMAILNNQKLRNAGMNVAFANYKSVTGKDISFKDFINSKITVYRAGNLSDFTENDVFISYSFSREAAEKFGSNVSSIKVRPADTLGSYQTTGEAEILVRNKR